MTIRTLGVSARTLRAQLCLRRERQQGRLFLQHEGLAERKQYYFFFLALFALGRGAGSDEVGQDL